MHGANLVVTNGMSDDGVWGEPLRSLQFNDPLQVRTNLDRRNSGDKDTARSL